MPSLSHSSVTFTLNFASSNSASDLLHSSHYGASVVPLKSLGRAHFGICRRASTVSVKAWRKKKRREYPWDGVPVPKTDGEVCRAIHPFKPLKEKPKPIILDFEKPLIAARKKIIQIKKLVNESDPNLCGPMISLVNNLEKALEEAYRNRTPIQRVYIARHPQRPTCLDHIFNITDDVFVELHGDRHGYDDPAIVTGLGRINDKTYMFIGHQKGRNTKESVHRNFGMPTPHGYRKALRMMHYADHYGFPIVTFIDTPGAFADLKSEHLNQGEAIAVNLETMFGLKVPIISFIIGEGGSGGALAIACANKLFALENGVFYVASPEACAAILYKTAKEAPKAARKLRITATELCKQNIADGIIHEPLGGAHNDPYGTSQQIKTAILKSMEELTKMDVEELLKHRQVKFRNIGQVREGTPLDPYRKRNTKKREAKDGLHFKNRILDPGVPYAERMSNAPSHAENLSQVSDEAEGIDEDFFEDGFGNDEINEEFAGVLDPSGIAKEIEAVEKEIEELERDDIKEEEAEFDGVLDQSDIDKETEALRKEIEDWSASSLDDLPEDMKSRLLQLKKAVRGCGGAAASDGRVDHALPLSEFRERTAAINREMKRVIDNSPDLTAKIRGLQLEVEKAGKRPGLEMQSKLRNLEREVKQGIDEALKSSEKYQKLVAELPKPEVRTPPDFETMREMLVMKHEEEKGTEEMLNSSEKLREADGAEISEGDEP